MTTVGSHRRGPPAPPVEEEQNALFAAAMAVVDRDGAGRLTVAGILSEAGLASRAFYRHFASKDDFLMALWLREAGRSVERLRVRVAAAEPGMARVEAWIDDRLDRIYDTRGDVGHAMLWRNSIWLRNTHPGGFRRVMEPPVLVLRDVIADAVAGGSVCEDAVPDLDARSIHAVLWVLAEQYYDDGEPGRAGARAQLGRIVRGLLEPLPVRSGAPHPREPASGGEVAR